MRIGIVGNGVVGSALAATYRAFGDEVRCYDRDKAKSEYELEQVVPQADVAFVCLPTPQKAGGLKCDTSAVVDFFNSARYRLSPDDFFNSSWVLRSTVPVGFTRYLVGAYDLRNLIHSPEFLTARTAEEDAAHPRVNVVGVPHFGPASENQASSNLVVQLYANRFPHVPLAVMSSDESEAVKLMTNSFFATKVALFNEFRTYADAAGLDWKAVVSAMVAEGRVGELHTAVPGHDGLRGYGGSCLPKDIANLIDCIERVGGCSAPVLNAALNRNRIDRAKAVPRG